MRRVIFALAPEVEVLDLAGPVQAFHEANRCGGEYRVHFCAQMPRLCTEQGLWLSDLEPYPEPAAVDARVEMRPVIQVDAVLLVRAVAAQVNHQFARPPPSGRS